MNLKAQVIFDDLLIGCKGAFMLFYQFKVRKNQMLLTYSLLITDGFGAIKHRDKAHSEEVK